MSTKKAPKKEECEEEAPSSLAASERDVALWYKRNFDFKAAYAKSQKEARDRYRAKDRKLIDRTPELEQEILDRLENGETISKMTEDTHLPSDIRIYRWMRDDPDFAKRVAESRSVGAHAIVGRLADKAAQVPNVIIDKAGNFAFDSTFVAWQRMQVDTDKWIASKYLPREYGDKRPGDEQQKEGGSRSDYDRMMEIMNHLELSKRVEKVTKTTKKHVKVKDR